MGFTALFALPVLAAQQPLDLPQLGEPADTALSPAQESAIGAQVVNEMLRQDVILDDPELSDYLSGIGWRLAAHSTTPPPPLTFFVVNDPRINAFALPGGYIGVNAGLLFAAENESELAGVLGHELTHVTQRHIARQIQGSEPATIATWAAVLAAIIAGSANPDVVIAALGLGQGINYQRQVSYTRANEWEADRLGIGTMARSGFDPDGMASFFGRLAQQSRLYGSGLPDILRDHPVDSARIAEAMARAAEYPRHAHADSVEFGLMRARARVLTADHPSEAVAYFAGELQAGHDPFDNRYGLALALARLGQYKRAAEALAPALEKQPRQVNLRLLHAQLQLALDDNNGALATLRDAIQDYPKYAPVILQYADALIAVGRPEEARNVLLGHEQALGMDDNTYKLLAQAAQQMGNAAEAHFQMANFLVSRGDAGGALAQLDAGLRIASLNEQDRARLRARRDELRAMLPRNYRPSQEQSRYAGVR